MILLPEDSEAPIDESLDREAIINLRRRDLKFMADGEEARIFRHPKDPKKIIKIFHDFLYDSSFVDKLYISEKLYKIIKQIPKRDREILYKHGILFPQQLVRLGMFYGGYTREDAGNFVSLKRYRDRNRIEAIAYYYLLIVQVALLASYGIVNVDTSLLNHGVNSNNPDQLLTFNFGTSTLLFDDKNIDYNKALNSVITKYYHSMVNAIIGYFSYDRNFVHEYDRDYNISTRDDLFRCFPMLKELDQVLCSDYVDSTSVDLKLKTFMYFIETFCNYLNENDREIVKPIMKQLRK